MIAPNPNSPEILQEEILADAHRESDAILRRARQDAEALRARFADEADQFRQEHLDQARAEAARHRELILATVAVETGRLRSARIESWLQSIREASRQMLQSREGFDYRETLIELVTEAMGQMAGDKFIVKLSPADCKALGDRLAEDIRRRSTRPVTITVMDEPSSQDGGPIVEDTEGRQLWDNRFQSRLERLWPELRRHLAATTLLVGASGPANTSTISGSRLASAAPPLTAPRPGDITPDSEKVPGSIEAPLDREVFRTGGV